MLLVILACSAAFFVAGCLGVGGSAQKEAEAEAPTGQPNIIFVLADDLDYASAQQMPEIHSLLRAGGASFENTSVSYPICCPSRATMLTGLYAHNHNVRGNKRPVGGFEKFQEEGNEEISIAARLQENGYRTALIGKYLNGYGQGDQTYVPPGWDEWYAKLGRYEYYDYDLNENGEVVSYGSETGDYLTDVLSGKATDFVRRAAVNDVPFFAYVAPTAPHSPATPAERHKGTLSDKVAPRAPSYNEEDVSDKPSWIQDLAPITEKESSQIDDRYRERLEATLAVDEMVRSLVDELEVAGELDNTYIVFTSDNGYQLGERRLKHGKKTPYEESAHVPLFVRGPGVPVGSTVDNLVLNTDLVSTFAELGGLEGFESDGRSLAPLMRGEEPPSWRSAVLLEAFLDGKSAGEGGDGEGDEGSRTDQTAFQAVRTGNHKYVEYGNGEKELYDLANDPYELENVYESADASLVEDLKARLEALRDCSGDECREAEDGAS
jgi:arylsulfatase A-like enzyme